MAIKNNWDVAHAFFYTDRGESFKRDWINVHYEGNLFFSYGTVIAKIVTGLDGYKYTLLSYDRMSPTTGRHISMVHSASPYPVIYIPMEYGCTYFDLNRSIKRIYKELDFYAGSNLRQQQNRNEYIALYEMLEQVNDFIAGVPIEMIEYYRPLYLTLMDEQKVKELKRNLAKDAAKARAQARERLRKYIDTYDFCELARIVYDQRYAMVCGITPTDKELLRKFINPNGDYSFVWYTDDGNYCTSKRVKMEADVVHAAIKRYKSKLMRHGDHLGMYTVLSITDKFIQIGCHRIPIENINAIIDRLITIC